jgi:hypothetical protein
MQGQYVLHLLPSTHQDDVRLRAKHTAINANRILQSLFVFDSSGLSGLQAILGRKPPFSQSPTGKGRGGSDREIAEATNWTLSADPSLRQLPSQAYCHLILDVRWRSVMFKAFGLS